MNRLFEVPPADRRCLRLGLMQRTGTCWFNAAINGFLLSDVGSRLLAALFYALPASTQAHLLTADIAACPTLAGLGDHMMALAGRYAVGRKAGMRADRSPNYVDSAVEALYPGTTASNVSKTARHVLDAILPGRTAFIPDPDSAVVPAKHDAVMMTYFVHDDDPIMIDFFVEANPEYQFSHEYLSIALPNREYGHAVAWYPCGGEYYLSDSNMASSIVKIKRPVTSSATARITKFLTGKYHDPGLEILAKRHAVFVRTAALTAPASRFDAAYPPLVSALAHPHPHRLLTALRNLGPLEHRARVLLDRDMSPTRRVVMADAVRHFRENYHAASAAAAAQNAAARLEAAAAQRAAAAAAARPPHRRKQPRPTRRPDPVENLRAAAAARPLHRRRKQPRPTHKP